MNSSSYKEFQKKITADLTILASDSKRRYGDIKLACDRSLNALDRCSSFSELCACEEFVDPFILACTTENVKLASTSMLSYQRLATEHCISSQGKIDKVLDSFITCTGLAMEIQLKVLQILPVFFKTYSIYITGNTLKKLLSCFTILLQNNKSSVVVESSNATLQQLINSIFERSAIVQNMETVEKENDKIEVLVDNESNTVELDKYEYDCNVIFTDICLEFRPNSLLDSRLLSISIVLEILESIFLYQKEVLTGRKDLQFILKTLAVPLLLKEISAPSNKNFAISVRSFRATKLLIDKDYIGFLDLELEVVLSFLNHIFEGDETAPQWKKTLVLEFFANIDFETWMALYASFDAKKGNRKEIVLELLTSFQSKLEGEELESYLIESPILGNGETPMISYENSTMKTLLLDMIDKPYAPVIDQTYGVLLLLSSVTKIASDSESYTLKAIQNKTDLATLKSMVLHIFPTLLQSLRVFFYSSTLDTNSFHKLVRAFQKLSHTCGLLKLDSQFSECLDLFSTLIVQLQRFNSISNTDTASVSSAKEANAVTNSEQSAVGSISESFLGSSSLESPTDKSSSGTVSMKFYSRSFHSRNLDLLKAFIALFVSSSSYLSQENWTTFFKVWQWCNYYLVGPSHLFTEMFLNKEAPESDYKLSKQSLLSLENNFSKFFDATSKCNEPTLNVLFNSLISLSREALADEKYGGSFEPFDENRKIEISTYNRDFFMKILESVTTVNNARVFRTFKKETWEKVFKYLITEASARKKTLGQNIRLEFVQSFNTILYGVVTSADSNEAQFGLIEKDVMQLLVHLIDSILNLGSNSSKDMYNGNINIESDILLQSLKTVKDLVDNYGDYLHNSWSLIFRIIDSPFSMINHFQNTDAETEEEREAIQESLQAKHKAMIQVSFSIFKLISDDFLQTLPLVYIKSVIQTLVYYVSQDIDLNISFSSISYFWVVGDYLRYFEKTMENNETQTKEVKEKFVKKVHLHQNLDTLMSSDDLSESDMYSSLWLLLLERIIECSKDKRLEVKNGAAKTFFHIVDSHNSYLPSWDLIFDMILAPLLAWKDIDNIPSEFADIILKGLLQIFSLYFGDFSLHPKEQTSKWSKLIDFVGRLLESKNFDCVYVVFENFKVILDSCLNHPFPDEFIEQCFDVWRKYEIDYTDFSKSHNKTNYDCIDKMVACYPSLHNLLVKNGMVSNSYLVKTIQLLGQSIKYPLLPPFGSDKLYLSSLQKSVLAALNCFSTVEDPESVLMISHQYATISVLQFGTNDTIKKKLGAKLPSNAKSRIPTFEAVSYEATQQLRVKVEAIKKIDSSILSDSKYYSNMMSLLSELTISKSYIDFSKTKENPLWVLASKVFYDLSLMVFALNESNEKHKLSQSSISLYVKIMISFLTKSSDDQAKDEMYRIQEYNIYKALFLENLNCFDQANIESCISSLWSCSFFYEIDEVEDEILSESQNLHVFINNLVSFDFENILGTIEEPIVLKNHKLSHVALDDLIAFAQNKHLKAVSSCYLVSRVAIVIRKFISDEKLRYLKPPSTVRAKEIIWVLDGLFTICENATTKEELSDYRVLYSFILKTIPVANKVPELQSILQKLCLVFANE